MKPLSKYRLPRSQQALLLVLGIVMGVVLAIRFADSGGAESDSDDARQDVIEPEASSVSLADQIKAGRAGRLDQIVVEGDSISDQDLSQLDESMTWVETLIVDEGVVTDEGLESIAKLPNLRHLRLRLSPITDTGLELLSNCPELAILNLPHATCTVDGLKHLVALANLRNLRIASDKLEASAADAIAELTTLRSIHLIGVPIDDAGLRKIAALENLQSLYLDDAAVTESGWDWLFENHPDLHVHVNQDHHDRDPHNEEH